MTLDGRYNLWFPEKIVTPIKFDVDGMVKGIVKNEGVVRKKIEDDSIVEDIGR